MDSHEPRPARRVQLQQQQQARSRLKHQKLRASFIGYTIVLVFLALLQCIGIYLFTKGFLLSRQVLPDIARCSPDTCFATPKFDRAVVLVVDALRFDFAVPVDPAHALHDEYCHNHFSVLYELAQKHPENAVLLKFLADPPTTTLQRLKGLTTGSLPTFIDAGSNFNGDAISEDNWVLQLHKHNRTLAFMGDDTWTALFDSYICPRLNFPYESLNVWDLHTVDDGVASHLFPLLPSHDWDVLVGHFLGVDHAGHRYGPSHRAMQDKLRQMDSVVRKTIDSLDENTLLVVMGDHGMDRTGNHGGESKDELESTLFFYTKAKNANFAPQKLAYDTADLGANYRAVNQIDLVPTISLLLGLPVPYNNLGFPIDEVFGPDMARASRYTINQLARYRDSSKEVQTPDNKFEIKADPNDPAAYVMEARQAQQAFLEHCKSLWARFDLVQISLGIAVLLLALSVVTTYSRSIPSVRVSTMSFEFIGSIIAMSLLGLVLSLSIQFVLRPAAVSLKTCLLCGAALGITIGFWAPIMDRFSISWLWHQMVDFFVYNFNMWSLISLVFVALHCLIFASNSFVVWEDKMVNYFVATFGFCCLYGAAVCTKPKNEKILGIMHAVTFIVLTRLVSTINLCREEQSPYCIPTFKTTRWSVVLLYVAALVLPKIVKSFYTLSSSYHSAAPLWIESGLTSMMLMNAAYWSLELFENDPFFQTHLGAFVQTSLLKSFKLAIARIVLFTTLVLANFSWSRGPLCVKIEFSQAEPDAQPNVEDNPDLPNKQPSATILGYGNVYGSSYFLLILNVTVAVLLVTKPVGALSLCILVVQILTLLELYDLLDLRRNLIAPVIFGLLGYQHFFSTGHQATIPSIQWEVGFMTTQTIFFPFTHLNIFLNTFGSFLIVCLAIPLITLWKVPPSAKPITVLSQVVTNVTTMLTYQIFTSSMSFIFAANFRRHLMVWKIFAPRFMLSALLLIVLNLTLILVTTWFATGRVLTQVNRIFGK
ncbi:hypothetical protein OXX59_003329 [Metschnikowia pulcherrima]